MIKKYKNDEILQLENEDPIALVVLKNGHLLSESKFCNYKKVFIKKGIFSEEFLFNIKTIESLRNVRNSEVELITDKKEAEEFLKNNKELLSLAIKKRIKMLVNMNDKIATDFFTKKNQRRLAEDFKTEIEVEEVKKIFKKIYKYNWHYFSDDFIQKYISARELILSEEYEEAYENLKNIDLSNIEDKYFKAEIEIWKIYCLYFMQNNNYEKMLETLHYKYDFLNELISFFILNKSIKDKKIDSNLKTYFKKGYLIPAKTVLFFEGEEGDWSFLNVSGSVYISKFLDNKEILLNILTEGEIVGEIAVIENVQRTATVFTKTPLQFIYITSDNLESLINESYLLGRNILKALIKRVDFQKKLIANTDLIDKTKVLINKYSRQRLNKFKLTPQQFLNLSGLTMDISEFITILSKNKISTIRPDGTLYFK
ncbi:hypothetical protein XO10_02225 [Marinitoga sp. 1135]|uniref:Cyclic nucleotide-binding protein n=1 Tax=Marinitoga piezophila (strain DSM 14283 / JCM 11233 / KA3) TaxID=443254 RepID=H2J4T9_MARPK|nr:MULTISPECIES: cyclic nucleotide-binding domain-containing protein [Marinitoga]AEX84874.1 cyclic nucleotide-binding protein [Marinitoga piezophila KA3]NUU95110.1 hypothetical protein [Marinitoga sp. 1135]NUU97042.1 hypothetical protein [Marinitoga sp. 1138]